MLYSWIGDFSLRSLKKHHIQGNREKKPVHAHTREDILRVLTFIHHYATVNGLPQPAPPNGRAGHPLLYLPASQNKKIVHGEYEHPQMKHQWGKEVSGTYGGATFLGSVL